MYLERHIDEELVLWRNQAEGKPLLIRGARQVGKSTAIRHLAKQFDHFLEINFEEQRNVHSLFEGDLDPHQLCENLSIYFNIPITPGKTLLFFDEIQACIPAISSLRFFYEKYPQLHVVAAGSLLEFALSELPSFGVGRVRSMFMYPMSFMEYLWAMDEKLLADYIAGASPGHPLPVPIHEKALDLLKRFMILGGMPEVLAHYASKRDLRGATQLQDDLIISFRADFAKYRDRVPSLRIAEVFQSVVQQSGVNFVYSRAAVATSHRQIKEAVDLLIMAGLVIPVTHTSANGIPLGAEINTKKQKMLILDTGIFQRVLGLDVSDVLFESDFETVNRGAIAEQYVGLELLKSSSCYQQQSLYFWQREAKSSSAEVDYLIQKHDKIVPIEVKSGKKGAMQSLYLFLEEKNIAMGIRTSLENFGSMDRVLICPLYAIAAFTSSKSI